MQGTSGEYIQDQNWNLLRMSSSTRGEICPKLTIKTPERRQRRHSGVSAVNFEHTWHLF